MKIKVKFFSNLRNKRGSEVELNIDKHDILEDILMKLNIGIEDAAILMINGERADVDSVVKDGDIVSIIPLIEGG